MQVSFHLRAVVSGLCWPVRTEMSSCSPRLCNENNIKYNRFKREGARRKSVGHTYTETVSGRNYCPAQVFANCSRQGGSGGHKARATMYVYSQLYSAQCKCEFLLFLQDTHALNRGCDRARRLAGEVFVGKLTATQTHVREDRCQSGLSKYH